MAFTNSPLVSMVSISPNRNIGRYDIVNGVKVAPITKITKITIHHWAGVGYLDTFKNIVMNPKREMSANYAIDVKGDIGLFCPEADRSWCSSSQWNDNRAITIEVSNSAYGDATGWPISDASYKALIKLCVDICKRNGIPKLEFTGDENGSLTFHYMYAATSCLPIDRTELLTPSGWKLLKDIKIGDIVATAHIDTLGISFDEVQNIIPVKKQDTYTIRDLEATSDHRIVYYNQADRQYVGQFKDLYDANPNVYIPNAGWLEKPTGFPLSNSEIEFMIAVQADGHYMKDKDCYYGIEFHLKKDRKIKRIKKLLEKLEIDFKLKLKKDGTTSIRIYGKKYVKYCEQYLSNKCFTWDWLNMTQPQAIFFLDTLLEYDGCRANKSYSSAIKENVDVVQAIAAINSVGSKYYDENGEYPRVYFKKPKRSLGDCNKKRNPRQNVSCVTVRSGFILIRQHGRTAIVGNCPGPYIKARAQQICNDVNAQLNVQPEPSGYLVSLEEGASIYDVPGGKEVSKITKSTKYTIIKDKKIGYITYGQLKSGAGWVVIKNETPVVHTPVQPVLQKDLYTKAFNANEPVYKDAGGQIVDSVGVNGVFTIVEEKTVGNIVYGKLKSGKGWVVVKNNEPPKPTPAPAQTSWWSWKYDPQIKELQQILNVGGAGLVCDGIAGDKTFQACKKYTVEMGDTGNLIKWVQKRLGVSADGIAGNQTMNAIYAFQRKYGLGVGYLGGNDWKYLIR